MPIFVFTGRVLPDQPPLTLAYSPSVAVTAQETIPDTKFSLSVENGKMSIVADTASYDADTSNRLFLFAYDLARTAVEIASLSDGIAYTPIFEAVTNPDGEETALILADRRLAKLMTVFPEYSFEQVFDLVAEDVALMRVLSDTVIILTWPHYNPIAAARITESILRLLTGGRTQADWEKMRTTLRVDRAYLQPLTDHGVGPRHGDRQYVDSTTNRLLAERAWTLMNRYLAYRLSGEIPLDPEKFPMVQG